MLDEINQFSGRRRGVSSRNDESGDGFAPLVVGRAYYGDHKDARMSCEHILYVARINIEPAADDHVFLSIQDEHVAPVVCARYVVGVKPAIP